jgi:hypothetical protein
MLSRIFITICPSNSTTKALLILLMISTYQSHRIFWPKFPLFTPPQKQTTIPPPHPTFPQEKLNPNKIRTNHVQVETHGVVSEDCERYFWALTSPFYKFQLLLLDAAYAIGITTKWNSEIFNEGLRRLNKPCKPQRGSITWTRQGH